MDVILFFLSAAGICVTVGGLGLHFENKKRIQSLENLLGYMKTDAGEIKRRVGVIEARDRQAAEKIEIVHKYDDSGAPSFPSKGGF